MLNPAIMNLSSAVSYCDWCWTCWSVCGETSEKIWHSGTWPVELVLQWCITWGIKGLLPAMAYTGVGGGVGWGERSSPKVYASGI